MQKLQDSVFSILKTTSLSPAVFSFLQPTDDFAETPLGGILRDTKYGWLALGPKFCVVDLRNGLKVAARTFGNGSSHISVTSVIELPHPLTSGSQQLVISLEADGRGLICVLHVNGSQILHCIETDVIITELALCDDVTNGPLTCFDGLLMAGTQKGDVLVIDLNRNSLIQALTDLTEGNGDLIKNESDPATLSIISLKSLHKYERQGTLVNNNEHFTIVLNDDSFIDNQFVFRNPDSTVRMRAQKDHVRVTVVQYIPQLGSLAVGYNFGAFQLWNIFDLTLEYTSQVNVECLPVTHFGFQEPCDDPRAFCYLWVVFSVTNRFEEHEFPLAVMYSLTYQGKRMLADNKCLYQEFSSATICFQVELGSMDHTHVIGGRCISTHTFSINTMLGEEGEDTMLNLCQLVWECWGEQSKSLHYGMLMFDLDQWYKDQMPATYQLQSNTFMSTAWCSDLGRGSLTLDLRLDPSSLSPYSHATRLEEHFYPNSLLYNCVCLNTSGAIKLHTVGIQRQIVSSISSTGPSCLLSPSRLYTACMSAGLMPAYITPDSDTSVDEQRKFLLSVALEARMSQFLKRCAQDWATGTHTGVGCTLTFLVDWAWKRAIELKENAKELISPLFTSATLPDRNVIRCLEHCVQQLSQLTGLLDAVLTKCCNLVVPDALSEIEEKYKGIGTVSLYFQVIQWFLRVGLLPERNHPHASVPYPAEQLYAIYKKRRAKLHRIQGDSIEGEPSCVPSSLLYVDQLIINEFGGQAVHQIWTRAGSKCGGLYPPPSLYAMLRLYLLPDISEEHKHSLLLYLLLDYSMLYDDAQYEAVIRRLMQFPPMFGLSTTLVRATQAFWHLDHRDFHFALDQLQCLTGNTLSNWQHQVVLSSLLAQKKSQAALQYLHVRKPAPVKAKIGDSNPVNGQDKLEDWRSYCNLYLARGLVFEALDVVRMCSQNAANVEDRSHVLDYFFKGCRNSGQLSNVLQMTLLPFEEELFIKFLKECNEPPTSDLLIMYYLQQARFLEAEQYNKQMKSKSKWREMCRSVESMSDLLERESARDVIVEVMCSSVPRIANTVAKFSTHEFEPHVRKPKPMSVYVKAKSPKNTFTYKSSFIQDTIENASETWINKPKLKKGLKRALSIDETPFICTPKLIKTKSIFEKQTDSAQSKRAKLELSPKTPRNRAAVKVSDKLSEQIATLLEMPCVESPKHNLRSETPHSILKTRRLEYQERDISSPTESRYLEESDDDMETASNHTHYSDSTNKHLRFTIPTPSVIVPTPVAIPVPAQPSQDTTDHGQESSPPKSMESPPKKFAAERDPLRRSYKDKVKARKSSIFANSSLSDDPNTSLESIADIPVTLINPKYTGERRSYTKSPEPETQSGIDVRVPSSVIGTDDASFETSIELSFVSKTPKGRRGIHASGTTPVANRSCSITPERYDSPIAPLVTRSARSRSRTPEISPRTSPLSAIPEMPRLELNADSHPTSTLMSKPIRHRLRTPDKVEKVMELSRLEVIKETPGTVELPVPAPRRNLRSRSRTPEIEQVEQPVLERPRELRSRSKTPEKLMSPKKENIVKNRKSLSRIVLEANAFAKTKQTDEKCENVIECTPMKSSKQISRLMDVTFSPINKSVLQSSNESILVEKNTDAEANLPAFSNTIYTEESILHSYESSGVEQSDTRAHNEKDNMQYTLNDIGKSVLHSYDSSVDTSAKETQNVESKDNKDLANQSLLTSDSEIEEKDWNVERDANVIQQEKNKIVEIEWEINEIEGDLSDDGCRETDSGNEAAEAESEESSEDDSDSSEEDDSNDGGEDVISIEDSDSDIDQLQIDDQAEVTEPTAEVVEMEVEKEDKQMVHNVAEKADSNQIFESMEVSTDVMNQGQISLMTDDNSELEQSNPKCHGEDSTQIKDIDQADVQVDETLFKAPSEEEVAHVEDDKATPLIEVEIGQGDNSNKEALAEEPETDVKVDVKTAADEKVLDEVKTPPNKSKQESTDDEIPNTRPVQSESPVVDTSLSMLETPEVDSPRTRRRSKTPNIERRILTRRASRELSEMDDSFVPFEELTPRRRTRSTKKDDGNSSVTSDSSTKSIHTKASEEDKRKGRKIISTELTVIPEVEDSTKSQDIEEYSTSRRLTRHQKAQLGKEDHEGRRAMSEVKTVVKAARIGRSSSVDVGAGEPGAESPLATPIRGRRASFTRAIEALHTPKGRRASTDVKKDIDSNPASPAGTKSVNTPTRRSSRRASTQSASNTPEPGKRNRKGADKDRDVQE